MTNIRYSDRLGVCFASGYSIYRHNPVMCDVPGTYSLITNCELAHMQGAQRVHVPCVADDFGNLVAVPGRLQ